MIPILYRAWSKVRAFHDAFDKLAPRRPTLQTPELVARRAEWIAEELDELRQALNIAEQVDAYVDILYFALGGLVEMGVDPSEPFELVQLANMAKLWPDGKPRYREDGKIIKPPGWTAPDEDIAACVVRQITEAAARGYA
jgi:predicted HAD superfamily Cof-like phosphohydrolase